MLPNNRQIALLFTCLLFVQAFPYAAADNHQFQGVDLLVSRITVTPAPVVGVDSNVVVTVLNQGNTPSTENRAEVRIGIEYKDGSSTCIANSGSFATPDPCARTLPTIGADQTFTYEFTWRPTTSQAGDSVLRGRILTAQQGGISTGIVQPDDNLANNNEPFPRFVSRAQLSVHPLRDAAPGATNPNTPWTEAQVTDSGACRTSTDPNPKHMSRGCIASQRDELLFTYRVTNGGNAPDTYTARVTGNEHQTWIDRGYRFTFDPSPIHVPHGQSRDVTLHITIPNSASTSHKMNIGSTGLTAVFTSGLNPGLSTTGNDAPTVPSLLIAPTRGLAVVSNETLRAAAVEETIRFNVTLNNTGNAQDTYSWKIIDDSGTIGRDWYVPDRPEFLQGNLTLAEGMNGNVSFRLRPPTSTTMGFHTIDVEFQSKNDNAGTTHRTMTLVADVKQHFAIIGDIDRSLINRVPGETASYGVRIENVGNGNDTVRLELGNVPVGWHATLTPNPVLVGAFSNATVHLNVTPPPNTAAETEVRFFVNATSQGPLNVPDNQKVRLPEPLTTRLRVLQGSNMELVTPTNRTFVDPGETASFRLSLRNVGNVADNFTVDLAREDIDWGAAVTPAHLNLAPMQTGEFTVTLRAPAQSPVGETSQVFVTLKSTVDLSRQAQRTLTGQVSGPDLYVDSILVNRTDPYSGDPLEISVVLGNSGNKPPNENVTFELSYVQDGVTVPIGERRFSPDQLPGGRRLTERFVWNQTIGVQGVLEFVAVIDPRNEIPEIDDSAASNQATRTITMRTFDIDVVPAVGLSARPGETVAYDDEPHVFIVTYRGNQPSEPVRITIASDNGWVLTETTAQLIRHAPTPFGVTFTMPAMPGVAQDTLRITVTPTLRPGSSLSTSTTTSVIDDVKPTIESVIAQPASVHLREEVTIFARVADATGLSSVRVHVVTPENDTRTLPMSRGADGRWSVTEAWQVAGHYRVYVEALDNAQPTPNRNSSVNQQVNFTVTPGSMPTIRLADGQASTVRTGGVLKFHIADPLGVGPVSYVIRGLQYELQPPYVVDTSSWQPGELQITVRAANVYGAVTSEQFTIRIDNTPPGIHSVTLTPSNPRIHEDATLRIETDQKVLSVDVSIKRNGQIVETRQATMESPGVFTLLLNPGEGNYALDVTAKDEAGNAKLQEGAVIFSARPASFIPFVAVPALVGALAVAGLLRRRG